LFWLSHHHEDELSRTYAFGGIRVCARCLGTYPTLLAVIAAQFAVRAPLNHRADLPIAVLLFLPALIDWAVGRFRPSSGSNLWRTGTGVLLGIALGRTLYVHFQRPLPLGLLIQMSLALLVAAPVLLIARKSPKP
jgi:uncharacterized membrane protein